MLHIVNKSPFTNNTLTECLRFVTQGTVILLIEDGVLAAKSGTVYSSKMTETLKKNEVYVIKADILARGVSPIIDGIKVTDYEGFVDLVEKNKVHSWV